MSRRVLSALAVLVVFSPGLAAQSPRPNLDGGLRVPASTTAQQSVSVSVGSIIVAAYWNAAVGAAIDLPPWADQRITIVNPPTAVAFAERQPMWRAIAAERLELSAHYETRTVPSYDLVFAREDHALGPALVRAPARRGARRSYGSSVAAFGVTMAELAEWLGGVAGRRVVDRTALDGFYSTTFSATPTIFAAVDEQLGLKLVPSTTTVQVVVIDHIEQPTQN